VDTKQKAALPASCPPQGEAIVITEMLSAEAQAARQRGQQEAKRQLTMLTSYLPPPNAIRQLRDEAAEMMRYCWETDRGWIKLSYYEAMKRTYDKELASL